MAKKEVKKVVDLGHGVGRRKTAVARVYLREGEGKIVVNGRDVDSYFGNPMLVFIVKQPLVTSEAEGKYDILINVVGG
ncbi:MAG: 30S ribosomal protein S9, partial [Spirochaetales bacterium]|nr:30S ribosomal protein S9 [Spirochaetales bacterium]